MATPLDYQPATSTPRRRRVIRWFAGIVTVACVVALVLRFYAPLADHVRVRSLVSDCLACQPPADAVVYAKDPAVARELNGRADYHVYGDNVALLAPHMDRLTTLVKGKPPLQSPVLTGVLSRTPGERRIVQLYWVLGIESDIFFSALVIDPGTWRSAPRVEQTEPGLLRLCVPDGGHLRIFAGAADAADGSAALFPYELNAVKGMLRLRLGQDGSVELTPDSGPLRARYEALKEQYGDEFFKARGSSPASPSRTGDGSPLRPPVGPRGSRPAAQP